MIRTLVGKCSKRLTASETVTLSPALSRPKPAPDLFLACADATSTPPSHCIGVDDAVVGIAAIKEAGMRAVGIGDKQILKDADLVFSSLAAANLEEMLNI